MLETIWFVLWGVLWAMFFITDGFDFGMGTLMPFVAKSEDDRRTIYNAAGPFWDGNEVWLITAGGVTFAAFPLVYAVMFSGLYAALLLLLFALIFRGVSFEFRSKVESASWRKFWDYCQIGGSFLPALLLGVAFANLFRGLPIDAEGVNQAGLLGLLNPYGLIGGVTFVFMFATHGGIFLAIRSHGGLHDRALRAATVCWMWFTIALVAFLAYTAVDTNLYANYLNMPALLIIPITCVVALIMTRVFLGTGALWSAFGASALTIFMVTFFGLAGMFPNMIPSTLNPEWSLTAFNSAASSYSLTIMLIIALVMVPIVIAYQAWVYKTFSGKITQADLDYEEAY